MSEASRMERAIASAEAEDVDLADIVRGCAEGYRGLAGDRRLEAELPGLGAVLADFPARQAPPSSPSALSSLQEGTS